MERLEFDHEAGGSTPSKRPYAVVGVVASSDLEVMIERVGAPTRCQIIVDTAAGGFGEVWKAVVEDCNRRHALGGTRISINDYSASPSTVSLRLTQAVEALNE
ncbi:MAG: malonate decarboxylase acyl carrier protein [Gemmataceae bacterium]